MRLTTILILMIFIALAIVGIGWWYTSREPEVVSTESIDYYRTRLEELERKKKRGSIDDRLYQREYTEILRRSLASQETTTKKNTPISYKTIAILASFLFVIASALYTAIGGKEVAQWQRQFDQAASAVDRVQILEKYLEKTPDARAYALLGQMYAQMNQWQSAYQALEKGAQTNEAIAFDREIVRLALRIATFTQNEQTMQSAWQWAKKYLDYTQDDLSIVEYGAILALRFEDHQRAIQYLTILKEASTPGTPRIERLEAMIEYCKEEMQKQ